MRLLTITLLLFLPACAQEQQEKPTPHPLATAARSQVGVTTTYDPAYVSLSYPGGDVPADRGQSLLGPRSDTTQGAEGGR